MSFTAVTGAGRTSRGAAVAAGRLPIRTSHTVILAAWCGVLFLYGIASGPLYRTESLRAIIGRECLNGNWLFPILYGEPFLTKPPGHYVAVGLCSLPFGDVSAPSARLPSAIAATVTVFLVYSLFRRAIDEKAAFTAALLLPTSILWLDKVPSAEIDMTLVGWVAGAIVLFHRARTAQGRHSTWLMVLSLLCVSAGTLTKWTAPAFFYLTVVPFLALRGEIHLLFGRQHLFAVGAAGLVCVGWVFAVSQQIGYESLLDTVRKEAAYRFAPKSAAKGYPWADVATYPAMVFAAHLPVSFFALLTLRPRFSARWDDRGKMLLQLLHCWTWPNLLFWTLVPNHNVRYSLPMSPGLMGLGVMGLIAIFREPRVSDVLQPGHSEPSLRRARLNAIAAGFLTLWIIAKIVFVQVVVPARTEKRNPEPIGLELRLHVPECEPLYLFRLKDEGVMFYYGSSQSIRRSASSSNGVWNCRQAIRLRDPRELPSGAFALLIRQEWEDVAAFGHLKPVYWIHDQQGDPLILVRAP